MNEQKRKQLVETIRKARKELNDLTKDMNDAEAAGIPTTITRERLAELRQQVQRLERVYGV